MPEGFARQPIKATVKDGSNGSGRIVKVKIDKKSSGKKR